MPTVAQPWSTTDLSCSICGNTHGNRCLTAREMMFGLGGTFRYLNCASCRVLHLIDPPRDMSPYYPPADYYSVNRRGNGLRRWAMQLRDGGRNGRSRIGRWLATRFPNGALDATLAAAPSKDARVLDVGCGQGDLLRSLARRGYTRLTGVDPLLGSTRDVDGVKLVAGELGIVEGTFDVITFHHSLEHIDRQVELMNAARERLAEEGTIVVRVPTVDSLAFEAFGPSWFQLDAPRHLYLHSHASIERVAKDAALVIDRLYCDSQPAQFWASELYEDGLTLTAAAMATYKRRRRRFFRELSAYVNDHLLGDQMVVHLRHRR